MKNQIPNVIALIVIYVAVLMNWQWVWGLLFLMWTFRGLYTGEVHLITAVARKNHPILFWLILLTWVILSTYLLVVDFFPLLLPS